MLRTSRRAVTKFVRPLQYVQYNHVVMKVSENVVCADKAMQCAEETAMFCSGISSCNISLHLHQIFVG